MSGKKEKKMSKSLLEVNAFLGFTLRIHFEGDPGTKIFYRIRFLMKSSTSERSETEELAILRQAVLFRKALVNLSESKLGALKFYQNL